MTNTILPLAVAVLGALCVVLGTRAPNSQSVTRARLRNSSAQLRAEWRMGSPLVRYSRVCRACVCSAVILGIFLHPVLVGAGVGATFLLRRWRRKSSDQQAAADRIRAVANTVDIFAVVLGSGGTISTGVDVVARRGDPAIRSIFVEMRDAQAIGQPLVSVLQASVRSLGEAYRPMVRALAATERDGAPIATLLLRLAEQADTSRQADAETRAKRLSVHLLLPLTMCFLPAVLLGAVAPFVLVSAGRFLP